MDLREKRMRSFFGKIVTVKIDRPIGFCHKGISYAVNYGYIPDVMGGDGEAQDVYLLGVEEPVTDYTARVIGCVMRENDTEDKLVVAPIGVFFSEVEIAKAVFFQERFFKTYIIMCESSGKDYL